MIRLIDIPEEAKPKSSPYLRNLELRLKYGRLHSPEAELTMRALLNGAERLRQAIESRGDNPNDYYIKIHNQGENQMGFGNRVCLAATPRLRVSTNSNEAVTIRPYHRISATFLTERPLPDSLIGAIL